MGARPRYRNAILISSMVVLIAFYHYLRIFESFERAYDVSEIATAGAIMGGEPFNDAYRYVDWLLTVPLLLMELVMVMDLSSEQTSSLCMSLGGAAALMILFGYPGEISDSNGVRWIFWGAAMVPFVYIVYTLFIGLSSAVENQSPQKARELVSMARYVTVISWCTYPIIYLFPMFGLTGAGAQVSLQVGYTVADIIAKPIVGFMVVSIATTKSAGGQAYGLVNAESGSAAENYQGQ